jgi:acetolactate synthase I/II/III large subunit
MKMRGAEIVIKCLVEEGIDTVFGYPGGTILNIYDELYKHSNEIRHILTAHEQGAAHAADGYARASGKVGVCLATSGPGACNLVTGIATSYMDSTPVVAITCNVAVNLLGKDSFQEVDIAGITSPITKHNYIVKDVNDLAATLHEAFAIARSGRPGPVLIDITKDVTAAETEYAGGKPIESPKPVSTFSRDDIDKAVKLIQECERPLIYAGGGIISANASPELLTLSETVNAPVACSLMGQGCFPHDHRLSTGMIGMHGTKASNMAASQSDLLIAIGARFSDRVVSNVKQFATHAKILHIDIDPAEINKSVHVHHCVTGDAKLVLAAIQVGLKPKPATAWNQEVEAWKAFVPAAHSRKTELHPRFIMERVRAALGDKAILVTEVGQHQLWTAQFYPFSKPRTFISSGGLGTMGFGTGAAMGAQIAKPDMRVVHIAGDGSFRMNSIELATISHYNIPMVTIIMNNGVLGMVRQWQKLFYAERYSETTLDRPPDFVKLAEAYGVRGYRAANEAEFDKAFAEALSEQRPALIDCVIDPDEKVLPMVPSGKPIDEMIIDN